MNPALVVAALFVLIGAQTARVLAPRRLAYLWALGLAAAGLIAGEVIAAALQTGGPRLGVLHPVADVVGIVGFELAGALLTPPRRRGP
jgi:Co/Zn/Cd efflux system component